MLEQLSVKGLLMKRLLILAAMVAAMLLVAAPASVSAFAQESPQYESGVGSGKEVSATGVLKVGLPADVLGDGTHSIVDEETNTLYALRDAGVNLDAYVDQRVTVYGMLTPGEEIPGAGGVATSTLPSIDVAGIEPADTEGKPENPSNEAFQGYAANVDSAGMRIDSDQSGEPCTGGASLTAAFTDGTGFFARRGGVDVPITVNEISNGDLVLVAYTLAPDEAVPAICPSPPISVDFVTVLEDGAPGGSPTGDLPDGNTSGQYGDTSDQYTDVGSVDNISGDTGSSADTTSSANGSSAGVLGLLPDTGGLSLAALGLPALLLIGSGLISYRFIRRS